MNDPLSQTNSQLMIIISNSIPEGLKVLQCILQM